jgi:hypothetical protein
MGRTKIFLLLGGIASSDPGEVRAPLVQPFWMLAFGLAAVVGVFVLLRVMGQ